MSYTFQTVQFRLRVADEVLEAETAVPRESVTAKDLLPILRQLSDGLVQIGVKKAAEEGRTVSCGPHCGACCRQLVPISEAETYALEELVSTMPDERQAVIRARFAEGLERLRQADVELEPANILKQSKPEKVSNGLKYFGVGVPCPFLDDESCSIHPDRPVSCREYLVSNDPKFCGQPSAETIDMIPMQAKLSHAMYRTSESPKVVPLIAALEWVRNRPALVKAEGPELLRKILGDIT